MVLPISISTSSSKNIINKYIGNVSAGMFMISSCLTQMIALWVFYPYDMIKVRLQTSNHIYRYKGLKDAYVRIYHQHSSPKGLYIGLPMYMCTYVSNFTLQLTIYELFTAELKKRGQYQTNEYRWVLFASAISGLVASIFTNPLEVLAVRKQTNPKTDIVKELAKERTKLFTKGLAARGWFNSLQAITFFTAANFFGKFYNVELTE